MKFAFLVTVISISTFLSGVVKASMEELDQIPVLGSIGPRQFGESHLWKAYDNREINDNLEFCYQSHTNELGENSRITFIIQPALVSYIRILGRHDTPTGQLLNKTGVSNLVVTLCRINSDGEKECSRMGSMSESDEFRWSELTFEETLADEIQIHREDITGHDYCIVFTMVLCYMHIVICELSVFGQVPDSWKVYANLDEKTILQNSRIEGATLRKLPVYGALAPPAFDAKVHSILFTFDGSSDLGRTGCYVSTPLRDDHYAWFYTDYAKVTVVNILNIYTADASLARQIAAFKVSVCESKHKDGKTWRFCHACVAAERAESGEWRSFVCDHVGDIISLSRPVLPGDLNARFWLCEIQIWGHLLNGIFPNENDKDENNEENPSGSFTLEDNAFFHETPEYKEHRIPILGAIGPRAHWKWEWSRLRKVYDEGRDTSDINHCYHCRTLGTDGSRLTFIIHPAKVTSVRILGRGDMKETGVPNFVVSLCRINSQGEKVCSRMGSMPEVDEEGWSVLRFEKTKADEIQIHHEFITSESNYIVICEMLVFGIIPDNWKTYSHLDAKSGSEPPSKMKETTIMKLPVYGAFSPPVDDYKKHSAQNVIDGNSDFKYQMISCYESDPKKPGLREAWFFIDYAEVTLVKILNEKWYSGTRLLPYEIAEFEVSVCELEKAGTKVNCEPCVGLKLETIGWGEWMDFVCEHLGSIVILTRPIKKDDVNADFWLCEIQIWGHRRI